MEEQGFIYRQEDASNKNWRIYATEREKRLSIIVRENQHSNQVVLQGLSEVEISQLADYLVGCVKCQRRLGICQKGTPRNY